MKAEHISIAQQLEDIPHIGPRVASLLRDVGIQKPAQLGDKDALWLYNKICRVTLHTHNPLLLDRLLAAIDFAAGHAPKPLVHFRKERERLLRVGSDNI